MLIKVLSLFRTGLRNEFGQVEDDSSVIVLSTIRVSCKAKSSVFLSISCQFVQLLRVSIYFYRK